MTTMNGNHTHNSSQDRSSLNASADKLEDLALALQGHAKKLRDGSGVDIQEHSKLVSTFHDVENTIHTPLDDIYNYYQKVSQSVALGLFVRWNVFAHIPAEGTIAYDELASKVEAETNLIRRFAWALVSCGILRQEGTDRVAHTGRSQVYASLNPLSALASIGYEEHMRGFAHMANYFDKFGRKEPRDFLHTTTAFAEGKLGMSVWDIMSQEPRRQKFFMTAMAASDERFAFPALYDFSWVVAKGKESPARVLVVDVGGGKGHVLKAICEKTPGLDMSRCVLEDLAAVNEETKRMGDQELLQAQIVAVNFHKGQPIKGACIYHMRQISHDYSDQAVINILGHISKAMAPDSKLLIVDKVLGNPPVPMAATADLFMMNVSGKERTLEMFRYVTVKAGLKVSRVYGGEGLDISVVECEKKI